MFFKHKKKSGKGDARNEKKNARKFDYAHEIFY